MTSKKGQLKWGDILSIIKTSGIMYGVPALIFILNSLLDLDFGKYTLLIGLVIGILIKLLQKLNQENNYPQK